MQDVEEMDHWPEKEQISDCLQCKKPECTNCKEKLHRDGGKKPSRMYEWNGKLYSVRQLSEATGKSITALRRRIQAGGVEFAVSDCRKIEDYQEEKREPEKP